VSVFNVNHRKLVSFHMFLFDHHFHFTIMSCDLYTVH